MVEKTYQLKVLTPGYWKRRLVQALFLLSAFVLSAANARAESISLIADEETESFLAEILRPIYKAAGIRFNRNNVYIVNDNSLNAFVADGNNMFVNTGTLMKADNYNQLSGVLAHETGHIQGGHILRQKLKLRGLQQASLVSLIAAGVLGAVSGRPDAGMAVMLGSQTSALHNLTAYQMQEERSADEAAVNLLEKTGQSPAGLRDFMKKIQQQNMLSGIEETPYFRTHPVTAERISFMSQKAEKHPFTPNAQREKEFKMVQAKLTGFLAEPNEVFQKYPNKDNSAPARYARSIALFRQLKIKEAEQLLDSLIADEPENPYFHEMKAQIYIETGKIKPAKREYQKAYELRPGAALFQINLAQAMLEDEPSPREVRQIINLLNKSLIQKPDSYAWLMLARAYGMQEDMAYSNYASAEYSLRIGALDTAERQVKEALKANPPQSLRLKLEDLNRRLKSLRREQPAESF